MSDLSKAIALAHMERAKDRARYEAKALNEVRYIVATKTGLRVVPAVPVVAPYYWIVSPDGTVMLTKPRGN